MSELTIEDLEVGGVYRAKRPRKIFGEYDDRVILWMGKGWDNREGAYTDTVQYDSASVKAGRQYPTTTVKRFLKWAKNRIRGEGKDE